MAAKHYTFQENQAMMPKKIIVVIVTLLVLLMGLFGYMYIAQEFHGKPVGENALPAPWALAIFIVTGLLTFYVSRLKIITRVTDKALTMSLGVIGKRKFPLEMIEEVKDYQGNSAADFLGYGYRIAIKQTGYIGRAEQAVTLKINGQKRELVITTEKPEELKQALQPKG